MKKNSFKKISVTNFNSNSINKNNNNIHYFRNTSDSFFNERMFK